MIKDLFKFGKEDTMMWGGIGIFTAILVIIMAVFTTNAWSVVLNVLGLIITILIPGYIIVKLYLDNVQIGENLTKNPIINKAIDKLIMSFGCGVLSIIPLNFIWNYVLTMGGGEAKEGGNIWGNVDEEIIYTGGASLRSGLTILLVMGVAIGIKIYQLKKKNAG